MLPEALLILVRVVGQYVASMTNYPELVDMVASVDEEHIDEEEKFSYPEVRTSLMSCIY